MEVVRLVGLEIRKYKKEGEERQYCGLHLLYPEGAVEDVMGNKVELASCPRRVNPDDLEIGHLYQLQYDLYTIKGQKMARLCNLLPVEDQ